ncbi:MAG: TonB-dependent receptor [Melioribacteraceae bacterium]|nr:TonB-dependent receptor [Melioribacteraceae bacterium]
MEQMKRLLIPILLLTIAFATPIYPGTTGKISGTVIDKNTGEPLIFANIIIMGTSLGTVTNTDGEYTILHVPPGVHQVQFSFIGYRKIIVNDVRVFIDQTTQLNVEMETESIAVGELVVVAERKAIKPDVATSVVSLSDEEIQNLPVSSVAGVVGLQAGIRGMNIRGGGTDKILFMLDGVTLRNPRNNQASTRIALSAVKEISVERGGFNAEYGQVRSGLINVVTREGDKQRYSGRFEIRYHPPGRKYAKVDGVYDIHDPRSYVLRPFYDDAVAWTGTGNGAWDEYTRRQYPEFRGWNEISQILNSDNDPDNDLTPLGAQRVFMYETRKKQQSDIPDIGIDAGFGGPVPFVSKALGDLRFYTSYRSSQDALVFPLSRDKYEDYDWSLQLTSDLSSSMRLRLSSLIGKQFTMRHNWDGTGVYYYPHWPNEIADVASYIGLPSDMITLFSDFNFALADIANSSFSAKFTHTLNPKTFYEVSIENFRVSYNTRPSALRDTSDTYEVLPGFVTDSNPLGYWPFDSKGVIITGGQHVAKPRDFTVVNTTTLKADFTSQVNFHNLVKAGVEFNYNDLDFDYGTIASATGGKTYANRVQMRVFPYRAAVYLQDKLETKEFILNAGLRLDYSNSNSEWYDVNPFNIQFFSTEYDESMEFNRKKAKPQWQLSPRLGIAHPITENAKLFFNYGHFKQIPVYENMFRIQRTEKNALTSFGDPNLVLSKTVSYELGFDFSIDDDFLIQIAAYYNDISDQQNNSTYISSAAGFSYSRTTANNYEDIRGFEVTLRKTHGSWWSGFANYTYQVNTSGNFGSANIYDNVSDQKKYDEATVNQYQNRPIPQPYARANINIFSQVEFGPEVFGHYVFGGLMLNVLLDWQAGYWVTWNTNGLPSIQNNVQAVDYFNVDLRLEKTFDVGNFTFNLFMDVSNVFNTLRLWNTWDQDYMLSLHLPRSEAYDNIPGDDKVGNYREPGAEFQPMEYQSVIDITKPGKERPIYFEGSTGKYYEYKNAEWRVVEKSRIDKVLEDKAYIDMPNASTFWFLNPRYVNFGLRVSFNLSD